MAIYAESNSGKAANARGCALLGREGLKPDARAERSNCHILNAKMRPSRDPRRTAGVDRDLDVRAERYGHIRGAFCTFDP
jgi:hypothetical protein